MAAVGNLIEILEPNRKGAVANTETFANGSGAKSREAGVLWSMLKSIRCEVTGWKWG